MRATLGRDGAGMLKPSGDWGGGAKRQRSQVAQMSLLQCFG